MCRKEQEQKGLSFKQITLFLEVQQYKLKYIHNGNIKFIETDVLKKYIDYLELREWFELWKKSNADVYQRIGRDK